MIERRLKDARWKHDLVFASRVEGVDDCRVCLPLSFVDLLADLLLFFT
jgi:hypothetical protein